jgi:hypothetical protein
MARTFDSPPHDALREFLVRKRKAAGLRQFDLAKWKPNEKAESESAHSCDTCAHETIRQSYG